MNMGSLIDSFPNEKTEAEEG